MWNRMVIFWYVTFCATLLILLVVNSNMLATRRVSTKMEGLPLAVLLHKDLVLSVCKVSQSISIQPHSITLLTCRSCTIGQSVPRSSCRPSQTWLWHDQWIVSKSLVFLFLILWAGMTSAWHSFPRSSSSYTLVQHAFNTLQDSSLPTALPSLALHQCFRHQRVTYCLYMQRPSHPHFSAPQSLLCWRLSLIPQPHQMMLSGDGAGVFTSVHMHSTLVNLRYVRVCHHNCCFVTCLNHCHCRQFSACFSKLIGTLVVVAE